MPTENELLQEKDIEESPEEKLKKAEREDKTEETVKNENEDSGVDFDTVTKSIQNFVFSAGIFDSKLDISL